jgi:hypothetical protein
MMQLRDIFVCAPLRDKLTTAKTACGRITRSNCHDTHVRARGAQQGRGLRILLSHILILLSCFLALTFCGRISGATTTTATTITSPAPGSTLTSASTTFTWKAGPAGTTGYGLNVGTSPGGANLVNIYPLSGTSATVKLPTNGAAIYVRLWTVFNGTTYLHNDYTYTEFTQSASAITSPVPSSTLTSASTTFTWNAGPAGTTGYGLNVGTSLGGANLVNIYPLSGTSTTVNLPTNGATIYVRLWTVLNGTTYLSRDFTYTEFMQSASAITSPVPGSMLTSAATTFTWNAGPAGTTGYGLNVGTSPGGANLVNVYPLSGTSATVNLPTNGATIYVRLWTVLNGTTYLYNDYTYSAASSSPILSGLSCASASMTAAGTDSCTVTLNAAAPSGGLAVSLASNNTAVVVPASVTVAAGATTTSFAAAVSSVSTVQTVTLTASANSVAKTLVLQLGTSVITLSVSSSSLTFGSINVNTAATQTMTLSSTGTAAVTVSAATITGSGFTVSGGSFPLTLNPNQTATLAVQFDPTAAGAVSGSLMLTSNSSSGTSTVVSLSGTGVPVLSGLTCTSGSITGAGTDSCTVTLNAAAPSGGFAFSLASNNAAVVVPASVTVAAGATTASFTATVSSVSTAQTVTLTASANSVATTFALQLGTSLPVLSASTCVIGSMTGAGTDSCTVTLNAAAPSGGFAVSLASNNTAVVVPASVTVAAGATTASFTATVSSVSAAQTVTLTASANSVATTFALQLGTATAMLSTNTTTIAFGTVNLNSPATQTLILTSTGSAPVTISAAAVTGSGFTVSGGSFPMTLNPNQSATLSTQFDPSVAGAATGQLSITSNCSMGSSMGVSLSGTGAAVPYEVNLAWDAPTSSPDPVAGYNVYRAPSGSSNYQQLNSAAVTETTYVDTTVLNSQTYDYIVESVDASGVTSSPSNMAAIPVP